MLAIAHVAALADAGASSSRGKSYALCRPHGLTSWQGPLTCGSTELGGGKCRVAMDVRDGFLEAIGNTPLIRLKRASEETGCEILGKAEFLNPGSSVKDRAALFIVRDAEAGAC